MNTSNAINLLQKLPESCLSATRVERRQNRRLQSIELDGHLLQDMSQDALGLLVTDCPLRDSIDHIFHILERTAKGIWIIVTASSKETDAFVEEADSRDFELGLCVPTWKVSAPQKAPILTSPEWIKMLGHKFTSHKELVGVHLIDPNCGLQNTRPHIKNRQMRDRPEALARFIAAKGDSYITLPLIIWTAARALSVVPDNLLSAYALNAVWYVDGRTIRHK